MAMEKRGVVEPGRTRDVEQTQKRNDEKRAADRRDQTKQLDDDFTKRASDHAADKLK